MKHKRELVFVCAGSDCKKAGSKQLKKSLKKEFSEGEWKGTCKLISTKCMDMCKSSPLAIVDNHFIKKADHPKVISAIKKALDNQGS